MLFTAHRSVVFVGERLARHGIKDILDIYTHDPRNRLRTYLMVVKGGDGRDILKAKYPFEQVPIEAVKEMEGLGSEVEVTMRDFFIASSSVGISPVTGVIELEKSEKEMKASSNNKFKLAGAAIFKNFKLAGLFERCRIRWISLGYGQDEKRKNNSQIARGRMGM